MGKYTFSQLVDVNKLQALMERFYRVTRIPVGIIDIDGAILVATGWQEICTRYHRIHPETRERCRQSDAYIMDKLHVGGYIEYKCKNGLWDIALPLVIDGQHLANLFLGQFFYADETPDLAFFRNQAREFGFDEKRYLDALSAVPVFTRQEVRDIMTYYTSFVQFIMETGLVNLKRLVTERAMKESEARYRTIFQQSADGIALLDVNTLKFVDFNAVAHERMGYTREEFAQLRLSDIIEGFSSEKFAEGQRVLREKGSAIFEFRERTKSGKLLDMLVSVRLITYDGKTMGHCVVKDVTERKRMQEELVKAQKLESIGVLAGGIAHDFNNILTGIIGNLSIAKLNLDPACHNVTDRLDLCEKAAYQASELARQLLTFSKGGAPLKKPVFMAELIRDTVSSTLRGSNVKSSFEIQEDLWCVEADESQVGQVLNNIVLNAVQAMPGGGIITVRGSNERLAGDNALLLPPGDYVRVAFEDTGCGIAPEILPRIFDPYFTTRAHGSGLGLSSVYSIVKKHGGAVEVSSVPDRGSVVSFFIPAGRSLYDRYSCPR